MQEPWIELSTFDIFATLSLAVSVALNVMQWRERRAWERPLVTSLTALFNDIKTKTNHAYLTQQLIYNQQNPHADIGTLRWEYYLFTWAVIQNLNGLKETVVGMLNTVKPDDPEGRETFQAGRYGLSETERQASEQSMKQYTAAQLQQQRAGAPTAESGAQEESPAQGEEGAAPGAGEEHNHHDEEAQSGPGS